MVEPTSGGAINVGVVVIGRNEGERLVACLRSASVMGVRLVYVDSASTDGSQAAAREAGAQVIDLDLNRPFTAARARREGAQMLFADAPFIQYVQFIDGDCELAPAWIATARDFLDAAPNYAVACGRRRERSPQTSSYNRMADLEWDTPLGDADACGGDALMRVSAYLAVGGFNGTLIAGEEPELCARLRAMGWRIRRLDAEMTVHDAAMTRFSQWWKRSVRSGFGYAQIYYATRTKPRPLYRHELLRAGVWTTGPLALSAIAGMAVHPAAWLVAPLIYTAQVARLALQFGAGNGFSWKRAGLLTLGKVAETWGALRYCKRMLRGTAGGTITYK